MFVVTTIYLVLFLPVQMPSTFLEKITATPNKYTLRICLIKVVSM